MINDKTNNLFHKHSVFCLLSGIFLISLGVRILYYALTDRISRDSFVYIEYAELLYKSGWDWDVVYTDNLMKNMPPLYTIVMTAAIETGIGAKPGGILFCLFCGSLVPVGIYFCSVNIFKERIYAYFAALLIAFHPYSIELSANILRDAPYHCLFVFALAGAIYAINTGKTRFWILFGILTGLAALTRKEGPELLLIFFIWNIIVLVKNGKLFKERFAQVLKDSIIVVGCFCVITMPLWLFIRCNTDSTWSLLPFMNKILEQ